MATYNIGYLSEPYSIDTVTVDGDYLAPEDMYFSVMVRGKDPAGRAKSEPVFMVPLDKFVFARKVQ